MASPTMESYFEDDEAATLDQLVAGDDGKESNDAAMKAQLHGLLQRFDNDSNPVSDEIFWKSLCEAAEQVGFRTTVGTATAVRTTSASPASSAQSPSTSNHQPPAAFDTEWGKKHVKATSSLLRVSERRAIQLTLSALRSVNRNALEEETHMESLLGTRSLLKTVRDYHYQQKTCRLQIIAECLRVEQDDSSPYCSDAVQMLNQLDQTYTVDDDCNRGLFQRLLTISCAPDSPPTRDELLPTLQLREASLDSLDRAQFEHSNVGGVSSDRLVANCIQASREQRHRERVEAMDALLVLLYNRIDQGIQRIDLVLLLLAFQSCGTFFTTQGERLPRLAGLICAECMSLWLTSSTPSDNNNNGPLWIETHPMLLGIAEADPWAMKELESVRLLLIKYAGQVPIRKLANLGKTHNADSTVVDAPESIALYSFALLLRLAQMNLPTGEVVDVFETYAMQDAQFASDEGGVFDYLYSTMDALVTTPMTDSFSSVKEVPYDWQFSFDEVPLLLEGPEDHEAQPNDATVPYASIGHEILASTIVAFQSTIRSGNSISMDNVSMLCSLAATIYDNHPVLCVQFWKDLDAYTSFQHDQDHKLKPNHAIYYLMDTAYAGAVSALNAAYAASQDDPGVEESLVSSLVPFLQLMSSVVSNSAMVESVFSLLPNGIIRTALLCCAPGGQVADATPFSKSVSQILESLHRLARVGRSATCRSMVRASLEESLDSDAVDGPRVLYRIIAKSQDNDIVSSALRILGYLVENTTGHELWIAKTAKYFTRFGLGDNGLSLVLTSQSERMTLAGLHVLNGFVSNLATVSFCELCEESDMLDLMEVVTKGSTATCTLLSSALPSTSHYTSSSRGSSSYLIAHGAMRCLATCLRELLPVKNMHASFRVRSAVVEARNILIQNLATCTPVGQAISYFAAAPVSLSLANALDEALRNSQVIKLASDEFKREEEPKDYGAWWSAVHPSVGDNPAVDFAKVLAYAQHILSNINELELDLQSIQAKAKTSTFEPLHAASAALDLLRLWALHVDEIIAEQHGTEKSTTLSPAAASDLRALSPCRLLLSQVIMPPDVHANSSLNKVWPSNGISLIDLLVRYLQADLAGGSSSGETPTLVLADVLSLALVQMKLSGQDLQVSASEAFARCAPGLSAVMLSSIQSAASLLSTADPPKGILSIQEEMQVRDLLASLRLLRQCLDLGPQVVVAFFGSSDSGLRDEISGFMTVAASSLARDKRQFDQMSLDAVSTCRVRITVAFIDILLSLWQSSCCQRIGTSEEIAAIISPIRKKIVGDIISIVTHFSWLLPRDAPELEPKLMHCASNLVIGTAKALELLQIELSTTTQDETVHRTKAMIVDMTRACFATFTERFCMIDGAVAVAHCQSDFDAVFGSFKKINVGDALSVLVSFPAVYQSKLEKQQAQDNLCDVVAATGHLSSRDGVVDVLKSANASHVLLSDQQKLVSSWGSFAVMCSSTDETPSVTTIGGQGKVNAHSVLLELDRIVTVIEEAQAIMPDLFLSLIGGNASYVLAGLLLDTTSRIIPEDETLVTVLQQLKTTTEKLLGVTFPTSRSLAAASMSYQVRSGQSIERIREETLHTYQALQKRLLVVAMFCINKLYQAGVPANHPLVSRTPDDRTTEVLLGFVEVACKSLSLVSVSSRNARQETPASTQTSEELLRTCTALLALLLSTEPGSRTSVVGDSVFYSNAAALMKRFKLMEALALHTDAASSLACANALQDVNKLKGGFSADRNSVQTVQSIFDFVRIVAETGRNSDDILSLLSSDGLSKMIVDNALLRAASRHWLSKWSAEGADKGSLTMRGYLPVKDVLTGFPKVRSQKIVTGPFLSGKDDPVHGVWRTAIRILQAVTRAYASPQGAMNGASRSFLDVAVSFVTTQYSSLVACLEQCSSLSFDNQRGLVSATRVSHVALTFNALCESADILALVSSLCDDAHRHQFRRLSSDVYDGMIQASHTVLQGLSKFLAAAGTAREIFGALKEYEQESATREQSEFRYDVNGNDIHPLLASGIPNARHEAIKHAHYASRCCAYVTESDYAGLPSIPEKSGTGTFSTSSLERDSQLSMSSPFIVRMEHAAAECVSDAITVLSETHPAASSFAMFPYKTSEATRSDLLSLLRTSMIIAVHEQESDSSDVNFCRILHVDTIHGRCKVRYIEKGQAEGTVSVGAVAGIEDMTKRKPILFYSAAPVLASELDLDAATSERALGDVIIALRWCYQFGGPGTDFLKYKSIRKLLAENASTLLGTELSLHDEIGTLSRPDARELSKRVNRQLLHLFDESDEATKWDAELKAIIAPSLWNAMQQQLRTELDLARKDRKEEKQQLAERTAAINLNVQSPWLNPSRHLGNEPVQGLGFAGR